VLTAGGTGICECSITERKKRDQIHWKTDSGLEEVQKKCEERKYKLVMDLDQWGSNIKSVTRFSVECLVCDVVGETSCENLVTKNQEMKCLCNDLLPWSSEYRFFAMKNLCQTRNCVLKYKLEEWIEKVKTYQKYVPIYCNKCKTKVTTTSVGAFYSDIFGTSSLSQSIPPTYTSKHSCVFDRDSSSQKICIPKTRATSRYIDISSPDF